MPWACGDERVVMFYSFFFISLPPFVLLGGSRLTDEIFELWGVAPVAFLLKKKNHGRALMLDAFGEKISPAFILHSICRKEGRQQQNSWETWSIFHFSATKDARGRIDTDILSLRASRNTAVFPFLSATWKSMIGDVVNGVGLLEKMPMSAI